MRGHATDCPSPVTNQHVISDPDWNLFVVRWINCVRTGKHSCLFFRQIGAFELAFSCRSFAILAHSRPLLFGDNLIDEPMFRREHEERASVQRVGQRSENAEARVMLVDFEVDLRPFASANPFALEYFE